MEIVTTGIWSVASPQFVQVASVCFRFSIISVVYCWSIRRSVSLSIGLSVCLSVCQSVYRYVSLSIVMSVCPSVCPSVCRYVSLSIGMSVSLSLSLSLFVNPLDTCKYFPIVLSKAKEQWNPKQQEIIHRISDASNGCPSVLSN